MRQCSHDECENEATQIVAVQPYLAVARCDEHPVDGTVVYDDAEEQS